ncbi:DUF6894 family protein [Methylobacterium dankookense]|uniref:DUF6894 domain-containing protein n=1 Tax=Methylobacterium dankookense TaxID=560405 RepID=A0A564FRT8_9HYPH|nr:hypothetical protein [Methylobacterium dankookense]GJD57982.1 hypothetical protein IFDJLNFL_3896 [Methylobacterium dankookense]VUF10440.1 hypothetical protein MTDSW087_00107 [Methylobacterium dankookense]
MPRYFLDFQDGEMWLKDEEGQEYESLQAARDAAIAALPDIGREAPPHDGKRDFLAIVRDERGAELCTVRLNLAAECFPERQASDR